MNMFRAITRVIARLLAAPALAAEADPMFNFVVGDYVVIGREQDSGRCTADQPASGWPTVNPPVASY